MFAFAQVYSAGPTTPSSPTEHPPCPARRPRRMLPALRHVLLGINAHVNYDLPQAMLLGNY